MKPRFHPRSYAGRGRSTFTLLGWVVLGLTWWVTRQDLAAQPMITQQPSDLTVSIGATVTLQVFAWSASGGLRYEWYFNEEVLPGATQNPLVISNAQPSHAGSYHVIVSDNSDGFTRSTTATLNVDPTFTKITSGPVVEDLEPSEWGTWGDYDDDGRLDLFVANSAWGTGGHRNSLYRNLGGDEFVRVTNALTLSVAVSWGGVWGDYDNDGDLDLFVIHPRDARNELFRNDGDGVFTPVTNAATAIAAYHTDGSWIDHDADGLLDLFVTTQNSQNDLFFRNLGDGQFQTWTSSEVGQATSDQSASYSPAWCDLDDDGDLDLYVCSFLGEPNNFLYRNDGGRLVKVTAGSLPDPKGTGAAVWGDFNNDGLFDLLTGAENGSNMFHLNRGNWVFEDATVASGLAQSGSVYQIAAGDFDNDGDLDLYVPSFTLTDVLYVNRGNGTFERKDVGSPLTEGVNDVGAILVDYNNDGFLDLFKSCGDQQLVQNLLYRNSLPQYGNTNRWLKVRLKGMASNASGIGARLRVKATIGGAEVWQVRQISTGLSGTDSSPLIAHFGLGNATNVDALRVEWPSGIVQEMQDVSVNQMLTIAEPAFWMTMQSPGIILIRARRGEICVVKGSSDLVHWTTLGLVTSRTGRVEFVDPEAGEWRNRFYKAERFD